MNNYEPVIGLEVHVELNTKSKMFCRCSTEYFGKEPNTNTCPVCLGLPGALPYINKAAIEDCIKIGLALDCSVSEKSLFERKNYFYPDLPKGYQISQYRWPLCTGGRIQVTGGSGQSVTIRINRVHQEEDTAKLIHQLGKSKLQNSNTKKESFSYIDFNRSGVPLVEIVTEPDFHDTTQVRDYAKKLQQIFRYLGVSNADMEKGDMRLEANISVRVKSPAGGEARQGRQESRVKNELPNYRIELKNINSFRFMVAAIEYEIKRQIRLIEEGRTLHQETRGWNEDKKETYLQRSKEEAHDYRYFPEPDLPELRVKSQESRVKSEMPELPDAKIERFVAEFGLNENNAKILTEDKKLADFFEETAKLGKEQEVDPKEVANYLVNKSVDTSKIAPEEIVNSILSAKTGIVEDEGEIGKMVDEAIAENPKSVDDFKKGKIAAMQALIGAVMRKSKGKAHIEKVRQILEKKLVS